MCKLQRLSWMLSNNFNLSPPKYQCLSCLLFLLVDIVIMITAMVIIITTAKNIRNDRISGLFMYKEKISMLILERYIFFVKTTKHEIKHFVICSISPCHNSVMIFSFTDFTSILVIMLLFIRKFFATIKAFICFHQFLFLSVIQHIFTSPDRHEPFIVHAGILTFPLVPFSFKDKFILLDEIS